MQWMWNLAQLYLSYNVKVEEGYEGFDSGIDK